VPSKHDLREVIDALYASSPDDFTAERNAAAKRLAAEGESQAASKVKALRKPTQIAWVLNQLTRRHPDDVAALVDVGRDLARAQRKALRGGDASSDLRETIGRQRAAIHELTTKTAALMRELGVSSAGHLDEIAGALQAALVDPTVGAQLEEGRLEKVPEPASGFPGTMPVTAGPPSSRPRPRPEPEPRPKRPERRVDPELLAKRDEARKKADLLTSQAAELQRTAREIRSDARRLLAEARSRTKEADRAEADAKKAEAAARKAEHDAKRIATKARAR